MGTRGPALLVALAVGLAALGCTREVESPRPRPERPVAPITALQVSDLLSSRVQNKDGNLFVTVEPEECSGLAREVDPPFIAEHAPVATDGGHSVIDGQPQVYVEEMVGVYHADFDPQGALADVRRAMASCRNRPFTVTSMRGRTYVFHLLPPTDSGSPNIALWSLRAADWACDSAFVAAHNAAIGISTCASVGGYHVLPMAQDALNRIDRLANTTV